MVPIGFALCFFLDGLTLLARLAGHLINRNAAGSYATQAILVGSRFSVVLMFPAAGYLIDSGSSFLLVGFLFAVGALLAGTSVLALIIFEPKVTGLLKRQILKFLKLPSESAGAQDTSANASKGRVFRLSRFDGLTFLVTFVNACGLSMPMILAASSTELQVTYSHIGPLINAFATLANIVFIEAILTRSLEGTDVSYTRELIARILFLRAFALLAMSGLLGIHLMTVK
jgi:hypothetical protein